MWRVDSLIWCWCWEGLRVGGEGDDRGWDGWMASLTQWTWVWVNSGSWWWIGRPGVLWSMGSQRVGHNWVTELNWTELNTVLVFFFLAYFTLYNRLQFHPSHQNWFKCILFNGWVILHCVYVPWLSYPFICWWTSRLLPCPGYYKQCCDEHWDTRVSFNSGFLGVYA